MSLSQKHTGLLLVPWFNSEEWRYAYRLIYSNYREKQLKALDLLKMWKLRTPILCTGVEGTLIVLDALLIAPESMPNESLANIYAIALMRFLNLSAANADKQGLFTKTSVKNDLPKWLVNLRHDVAHGHRLPSFGSLKMGLDFGLAWLKEKYWESQSKLIKDYFVEDTPELDDQLSSSLKAYIAVNMALCDHDDLDAEYIESIGAMIHKKFKKRPNEPQEIANYLLEIIKERLDKDLIVPDWCLDELITSRVLLRPHLEPTENKGQAIAKGFRDCWAKLLSAFHQRGALFSIIEKLHAIVANISFRDTTKMMAALWINEIMVSLKHANENANMDGLLNLEPGRNTYIVESFNFKLQAFIHINQFTKYFMDSILDYESDVDLNKNILSLTNAKTNAEGLHSIKAEVWMPRDIDMETARSEDEHLAESSKPDKIVASSKWTKIENTSMFENCPLGVLPHQIGLKHPFLVV